MPSLQTCQATAGPPCTTDALAEHYNYREVLAERPHLGPNVHAARSQAGSVKSNAVQKKRQQTPRSSRKSGASIFADLPMSPPANPQALRVKKRGLRDIGVSRISSARKSLRCTTLGQQFAQGRSRLLQWVYTYLRERTVCVERKWFGVGSLDESSQTGSADKLTAIRTSLLRSYLPICKHPRQHKSQAFARSRK